MNATTHNPPFQSIKDACATTGLSQFYLRTGIKNGTIDYVRSGQKYLINVPSLLRKLNALPDKETASAK